MKLFFSTNSPYARRARMAIRATRLLDQVNEIDIHPREENLEALLAAGPGGKVPVLVTDTGHTLCESLVISHYLNSLAPNVLYPDDAPALVSILQVESTASVLMDSLFTRSREQRRDKSEHSPGIITLEHERAMRCYQALETITPSLSHSGALSEALNVADITTIAALGYADWRHADDNWRGICPTLAAWYEQSCALKISEQTQPVY